MSGAAPAHGDLWRTFGKIGLLSFGGPAAQIALMHRELIERRNWLTEAEFLRALSFCMVLPGPEAMQLATYAGWRRGGVTGGLIAGGLFVLPGALVILGLASLYASFGAVPFVQALFLGVKAAVVAIVIEALLRVSKRALKAPRDRAIALASFAALALLGLPFPLVLMVAAILGALRPETATAAAPLPRGGTGFLRTCATGLALWWTPVALLAFAGQDFLVSIGLYFSKLAVVTFGGAYAVLAYMTQTVVADYGWIGTAEMMDALGLAETTPGPLILVTEFVAYLAGEARGGAGLGLAAAALTLWVTFVPCFLWVFAFAPYVEWIGTAPRLGGALRGISAAVVGVIGSLALWFTLHLCFAEVAVTQLGPLVLTLPKAGSLQPLPVVLACLSAYLLLVRHWPMPVVLGLSAAAGAVLLPLV